MIIYMSKQYSMQLCIYVGETVAFANTCIYIQNYMYIYLHVHVSRAGPILSNAPCSGIFIMH